MKPITTITSVVRNACIRAALFASAAFAWAPAWAQSVNRTDLTNDPTGGKKLENIMSNVDRDVGMFTTVILGVVALVGVFIFVFSLLKLRSANPQDSKGMSIAGLFIGPVMLGIVGIMWAIRNGLL
ncbi:MAG: hypothetical protein LBE22_03770 [Azoarcus sp.]|jgi:uncharacterized membrane protein YeaQ/YmgE (transglycosylase-associated protein family)|nr:hypothetical protein [Azoarcus sp.]